MCLSLVLLVLVYGHGPSERALGDPVWTSAIISGFLVMGPLATLDYSQVVWVFDCVLLSTVGEG